MPPPSLVEPLGSTAVSNLNQEKFMLMKATTKLMKLLKTMSFFAPMKTMEKEICLILLITCSLNGSEEPYNKKLFAREIFAELILTI